MNRMHRTNLEECTEGAKKSELSIMLWLWSCVEQGIHSVLQSLQSSNISISKGGRMTGSVGASNVVFFKYAKVTFGNSQTFIQSVADSFLNFSTCFTVRPDACPTSRKRNLNTRSEICDAVFNTRLGRGAMRADVGRQRRQR